VSAVQVFAGDEVMLITNRGTLVRTRADEISLVGRNTQGVRLIQLTEDEKLVGVERVEELVSGDDVDDEIIDGGSENEAISEDENSLDNEINSETDDAPENNVDQ
jgi:DNA gyrase subunit A